MIFLVVVLDTTPIWEHLSYFLFFFPVLFSFYFLVLKCFKYIAFWMVNLLQVGPILEGNFHLKNVFLWVFLCLHMLNLLLVCIIKKL